MTLALVACGSPGPARLDQPIAPEPDAIHLPVIVRAPFECKVEEIGRHIVVELAERPALVGKPSCHGMHVEAEFLRVPRAFVLGSALWEEAGLDGIGYFDPYFFGDSCPGPMDAMEGPRTGDCEWSVEDEATGLCSYVLKRDADIQRSAFHPVEYNIVRTLTMKPEETIAVDPSRLPAGIPAGLEFHPARFQFHAYSIVHGEECDTEYDVAYARFSTAAVAPQTRRSPNFPGGQAGRERPRSRALESKTQRLAEHRR